MAEQQSTVEYRLVLGFPKYRVGNDGSVWRFYSGTKGRADQPSRWKRIKPRRNRKGRLSVSLGLGKQKTCVYRSIHVLVLEAFVGPRPSGLVCCHYDGNPENNHISNLRWDTYLANSADMLRHGTRRRGIDIPWAKLNPDTVRQIRRLYREGMTKTAIARRLGANMPNVDAIVRGKSWAWLED